MNKDLEYYNKIEEMFNDGKFCDEEIDILFHYMSCHINNSVYKCIFLDEYENISGTRKHEDIIKAIDDMYNKYKNL